MIKIKIMDPANPARDGWRSISDINGTDPTSLNGNIKLIFLTGIPLKHPTSAIRQPDDWSCGPYAMGEGLFESGEVLRNWLLARGWINSSVGTYHEGVIKGINAYGYSCTLISGYLNGKMNPSHYQTLVNHMKNGGKAILLMGGLKSNAGGPCRNSYFSNAGHYICAYDIDADGEAVEPTTSKILEDGLFGPATTRKAQMVFHTPVDGIISNQWDKYKDCFANCSTITWRWESTIRTGSELIKAIQKKLGVFADGICGPDTIKALQRFLGVVVDGRMGELTIKAFQKWLNKQN